MDEKLICYRNDLVDNKEDILKIVKTYIKEDKKILYILPTVQSIGKLKSFYIDQFKAIGNLTFNTFDGLKKRYSKGILKEGLRNFIFQNLIKNLAFKLINTNSKTIEIISNFYIKMKEDNIELLKLRDIQKPLFAELFILFSEYEKFLQKNNLEDDFKISKKINDFDLVVIDGFFYLKNSELEILKFIDSKIIFNVSYGIVDINVEEKLINSLKSMGFKIIDNRTKMSYKDFVESNKEKLFLIEEENKKDELEKILSLVKYDLVKDRKVDLISLGSKNLISTMSDIKGILISNLKKESSILIDEFIDHLNYLEDKNRDKLIKRLRSKYFELENINSRIYELIKNTNFSNYENLLQKLKLNIGADISSDDENKLFELLRELDMDIDKEKSFEYYSNHFIKFLENMDKKLYDFYKIHKRVDISRSDAKALNLLRLYLEELKEYDKYFKCDFSSFVREIKNQFKNCSIGNIDYSEVNCFGIDESLYSIYDNLYIEGFNMEYPRVKNKDFIFNNKNENDLISLGFDENEFKENYNEDLIKILTLIARSDRVVFSSNKEDDYSIFTEDLKLTKLEGDLIVARRDLALKVLNDIRNKEEVKSIEEFKDNIDYKLIFKKIEKELINSESKEILISGKALSLINKIIDKRGFRATDFDLYINRGYDFLYLNLLELDKKIEEKSIYKDLGILYHKILEEYYKKSPLKYDDEFLLTIINNEVVPYYVEETNENIIDLFKNIAYEDLKKFIKNDYENNIISSKEVEKSFKVKIGTDIIFGRIDRIDKVGGDFIITDYKTGSIPTKTSVLEKNSLQLPIYILSQGQSVGLARYADVKAGVFKDIIINSDKGFKGSKSMTNEEFEKYMEECRDRIKEIIGEIRLGKFTSNNISESLKYLRR